MIDEQLLRQGLQRLLKEIESAIRDRLSDEPELETELKERHAAAVRAERTEGSQKGYNSFAESAITQAAAHWILGCVFVRFLEDNGWLDERNAKVAWIAGTGDRLTIAKGRRTLFLRPDPNLTDRDYLLTVFAEVSKLPGVAGLFDKKHNPLFSLQPTGQGAAKIVEFFQRVDTDSNFMIHDFSDPAHDTRFLGDLYQNLSESARKRYALCQTPAFVIDFILDRTLTPALDSFGLAVVRLIDPSCGSGHFVLAAFSRLFKAWQSREPSTNATALVQRALDAVFGVDVNPFAIEISRFRLLIGALESSGISQLKDAPNFSFNLASGDSLLHGSRLSGGGIDRSLFEDRLQHFYDTEDSEELRRILGQAYHVVVGNPPYINVNDAILRQAYRNRFSTCHGKYQLGVPFTERFFDLTMRSEGNDYPQAGWMGMIVSNAFMKRSFGKKLIEEYLCNRDVTHVIDTSGVYLPGFGTPTTILLARHRPPVARTIRAVRGVRGETGVPVGPSHGLVWLDIYQHLDEPGFQGKFVSVSDVVRESFASHPWAIGGGGATELKELISENASSVLKEVPADNGVQLVTGEDEVFVRPRAAFHRMGLIDLLEFGLGDSLREWMSFSELAALKPSPRMAHVLWPFRTGLERRIYFGATQVERGYEWWDFGIVMKQRIGGLSIAYGEIATHNHFVLDRSGMVFNRTAPVIKLQAKSTEKQYLELLGLLNSSTACFWLKQICFPKGGDHVGNEGARVTRNQWEERYAFDSTKLKEFPIPDEKPLMITMLIQAEADSLSSILPAQLCFGGSLTSAQLNEARKGAAASLFRMIALQEELDWHCYRIYGIVEEDLTLDPMKVPPLRLGERAFELVLARNEEEPLWFQRHSSTPITELPEHWPADYLSLVERRIAIIESNRDVALIERPEFKRRWNLPSWDELEKSALKRWLLDRVESKSIWKDHALVSCARLRDILAHDADWLSVAEIYDSSEIEALDAFVIKLVVPEAVPFLPILRYTETGLRKRREWEAVWALQRDEDAGTEVEIPLPPKYASKDMQKSDYWRLRGGLDVPKERFILYPSLERDSDASPVIGWAGWSHLDQAKALATYFQRMRTEEGWEPERLKPILAGLLDLKPWLIQWHNELDPELGERLGDYFVRYTEAQCQELGFSQEEVLAWQPNTLNPSQRRRRTAR